IIQAKIHVLKSEKCFILVGVEVQLLIINLSQEIAKEMNEAVDKMMMLPHVLKEEIMFAIAQYGYGGCHLINFLDEEYILDDIDVEDEIKGSNSGKDGDDQG
ncbi:hypothetical protein ACJX0J_009451, partial [Zea mays]